MRTEPLSPGALQPLIEFVADTWALDGPCSEMHVGDVYTTLFLEARGDLGSAARLWYDDQSRVAAAAFFTGFTFDMVIRPAAAASPPAAEMIDWAIAELRRTAPTARLLRVQRRPNAPERITFLERLGFDPLVDGRRCAVAYAGLRRCVSDANGVSVRLRAAHVLLRLRLDARSGGCGQTQPDSSSRSAPVADTGGTGLRAVCCSKGCAGWTTWVHDPLLFVHAARTSRQ